MQSPLDAARALGAPVGVAVRPWTSNSHGRARPLFGAATSALVLMCAGVLLAACSGTAAPESGAVPPPTSSAANSAEASQPCDTATFSAQLTRAQTAMDRGFWAAYSTRTLTGRSAAVRLARRRAAPSALVAANALALAGAAVAGCDAGTPLADTLATGVSLLDALHESLAAGGLERDGLGGAHSIVQVALGQAHDLGLPGLT